MKLVHLKEMAAHKRFNAEIILIPPQITINKPQQPYQLFPTTTPTQEQFSTQHVALTHNNNEVYR